MPKKVIVIDGESGLLTLYKSLLECAGYESEGYSDPEEALERIFENGHDAIITSYKINSTDGLQLIRELRSRGVKTPILLHSSMDFTGHFSKYPIDNVIYRTKEVDTSYLINYCNSVTSSKEI